LKKKDFGISYGPPVDNCAKASLPCLGMDKNQVNAELMLAAQKGDLQRIKELIPHCDINVLDLNTGWTPLLRAAHNCHIKCCAYLVEKGADVNVTAADKSTVLHLLGDQLELPDSKTLKLITKFVFLAMAVWGRLL